MIWKKEFTLAQLNEMSKHCAIGHLGIEISAYYMVVCLWHWLKPLALWLDFLA